MIFKEELTLNVSTDKLTYNLITFKVLRMLELELILHFMELISSPQNSTIKKISLLMGKSRERKKLGLSVAEGINEIKLCLRSGIKVHEFVYCPELLNIDKDIDLKQLLFNCRIIAVTRELFNKTAYRGDVENAMLVYETPDYGLDKLNVIKPELIIVLEGVEKPGNLGAVLRTADGAGASAVIICDPAVDFTNPNVIRSSVGCVFTMPCGQASSKEVLDWLRTHNFQILCASLQSAQNYFDCKITPPVALVFGTEADGLSEFWTNNSDQNVKLPMMGMVDSLNVSAAAAIMTYEAKRRIGFN